MTNSVVPFGKYKGKPIETLREDKQYLDWLMAQDWFRTRHEGLFTIIVNNFGEASSTPEHNALQALFLTPPYAEAMYDLIYPGSRTKAIEWSDGKISYGPHRVGVGFEDRGADVSLYSIAGGTSIRIEVKPSVGDDYPAVLRQMMANRCGVLFLEHYTGIGVTREQFISIFAAPRIRVVFRNELPHE